MTKAKNNLLINLTNLVKLVTKSENKRIYYSQYLILIHLKKYTVNALKIMSHCKNNFYICFIILLG